MFECLSSFPSSFLLGRVAEGKRSFCRLMHEFGSTGKKFSNLSTFRPEIRPFRPREASPLGHIPSNEMSQVPFEGTNGIGCALISLARSNSFYQLRRNSAVAKHF